MDGAARGGLRAILLVRAPEAMRQGVRHLAAYKLRTSLAFLGILVGVASVVGSTALMDGVERMLRMAFEKLGGPRIGIVRTQWGTFTSGRWIQFSKVYLLTPDDWTALQGAVPELEEVCRNSFGTATVTAGRNEMSGVFVSGMDESFLRIRPFQLASGRFFTGEEVTRAERVAVIFQPFAEDFFGRPDPLGEEIRIAGQRFTVIGILRPIGNGPRTDWRRIYIPFETAVTRLGRPRIQSFSWIKARAGTDPNALKGAVLKVLTLRHPGSKQENFFYRSFGQFQDRELKSVQARGRILIAVAILCLLAGGVGVMNVFLMTVTERTAEIGLRIALGASRRAVLAQFLFEAVLLCGLGGAAGLVLGQGFALAFAEVVKSRMTSGLAEPAFLSVSVGAKGLFLAVGLTLATAALFGTYPAWRAARLDPAESLRHE